MHTRRFARSTTAVWLLLCAAGLLVAVPASAAGQSWDQPIIIPSGAHHLTDYRTLRGTGGVVYYRLTIGQPTTINISLNISPAAASTFAPQLVLFVPNNVTVGPLLPIVQPPQTIAQVYPMTGPNNAFVLFTQTRYTQRLVATPSLPVPGTYELAVYNAGRASGGVRLDYDRQAVVAEWPAVWQLAPLWWRDQTLAGFSFLTLLLPALFAIGLWIVWLRLDHHRLLVHKKYPSRTLPKRKVKS